MIETGLLVPISEICFQALILEPNRKCFDENSTHRLWDIKNERVVFVGSKDACEVFVILNKP